MLFETKLPVLAFWMLSAQRPSAATSTVLLTTVLPVEGGWSAVVRVPATRTDEAWALALVEEDDVLVQPGYFYDFERGAYLVVSLLAPEAIFGEGARRLVARVEAG